MEQQTDRGIADELAALARAFRETAAREFAPASPLYARLAEGVAGDAAVLALVAAVPPAQRRATLLLAAVHDLLLADPAQPLAAWYPDLASGPPATSDPYPAFRTFCLARRDGLARLLVTRATQTNEVGRCAGLLPALGVVSALAGGRPLALVEVGASAGLNLRLDRYGCDYGAGRALGPPDADLRLRCALVGALVPPTPSSPPPIASRIGIDRAPLDALDRALAAARADPPPLVAGDARAALPGVIAAIPRDTPLCLFHTATLAYFARAERARFAALVATLAAGRDLYWLAGEGPGPLHAVAEARALDWRRRAEAARASGDAVPPPVHWLTLTSFRHGRAAERLLAGMDPHGAWLEWLDDTTATPSDPASSARRWHPPEQA